MGYSDDFERDGFLVLEGFYGPGEIEAVQAEIDDVIARRLDNIVVDDLMTNTRLLLKDFDGARDRSLLKVNDLYLEMASIRALALNRRITPVLDELLGRMPLLCNSLYFEKGSSQPKHIDTLYMTPQTPGHLIAIWVAMEEVHPDAGPLEYYPGSHLITPMTFSDGTFHAIDAEMGDWNRYIELELDRRGLQKLSFAAKKGDVFIWHANLLHGGMPINDLSLTRKSLVFHYYSVDDGDKMPEPKVAEGDAFWIRRAHQPVPGRPVDRDSFLEALYLSRYPDVAKAVQVGDFASGWHHYETFGWAEGRAAR